MSGNGQPPAPPTDGAVLRWSGRVLSADEVRRRVNGHRRLLLPRSAVVTPLAAEELREHGVEWEREVEKAKPSPAVFGFFRVFRVFRGGGASGQGSPAASSG